MTAKIRTAFASCRLGEWPTPLEPAPELAAEVGLDALWLKREGCSSALYGGSKVRALEFLLAGAPADAVFVTVGGTGSTHCLATAVHARVLGRRAVLAQFPQPETAAALRLARAAEQAATAVSRAATPAGLPLAVVGAWRTARALGRPRWIPGGGAHALGVLGHVVAGLELAAQVPAPPDAIVVPFGSCGTAAGLALAARALEWPTRVIGVRVAPWPVAGAWRAAALARRTVRLARARGVRLVHERAVEVVNGLGRGYGHPTPAGEAACALAARYGVVLDPTYTAKAFGAMDAVARRGCRRVVFWHTFADPPVTAERSA